MKYTREQLVDLDWSKCPFPTTAYGKLLTSIANDGLVMSLFRPGGEGTSILIRRWGASEWSLANGNIGLPLGVWCAAPQASKWVDAFIERELGKQRDGRDRVTREIQNTLNLPLREVVLKETKSLESNMEKKNQESSNWPPPHQDLGKFSCKSHSDGHSYFVLRKDWNLGSNNVLLLLCRGPMFPAIPVANFKSDFTCEVTCDYSIISDVAAAIPRAEVFLRNLMKDLERPKLPADCEWIRGEDGQIVAYDNLNGVGYPVPVDDRQADIMEATVREYRLKHPKERGNAQIGTMAAGTVRVTSAV